MTTTLSKLDVLLTNRPKDPYGNRLLGTKNQDGSIKLILEPADGSMRRMVGSVYWHPERGVVLKKLEKEADKQRNIKAWSILACLVEVVDWVVYKTDLATYRIDRATLKQHALQLKHSNGYDRKVHVPIRYWQIGMQSETDARRVQLLGYEWWEELRQEFDKPYMKALQQHLKVRAQEATVFPLSAERFRALQLCPFTLTRVVIFGEEPWTDGSADGLAWSAAHARGMMPTALSSILAETSSSTRGGIPFNHNPDLSHWARQGVLLLNRTLTAETAVDHRDYGWDRFVDAVLDRLVYGAQRRSMVYMLWGERIQRRFGAGIDPGNNLILTAPSPADDPEGFFGCNHFLKCNQFLHQSGLKPIQW